MTGAMSLLCQLLLSFHPRPEIYVPRNTNCLASSTNIFLEPHACLTSTCSESGLSEAVEKPLDIYRVLPLFNVSSDSYVCMTPGCVKAAAEISANLDENVSPCDDFYQFACGGWIDRHSIPDDSSSVSTHSKIVITLDSKLRSLLERELTGKEPDFIQMQKQLYDTCMDT
ncbi:membrane metallo-endopeptidase-like 1, partial [Stegodyphus dumicola]|uniref:membrane metallo-endopeptidase-like 1 n=1 Tax=Stegodyphus dumicola TaxID=202533 RepID=UPI0015A7EDA7